MATLLVNLSQGNLHIDSLNIILPQAGRLELPMTELQLKMAAPELVQFEQRGRVRISEDAEVVIEQKDVAPIEKSVEPKASEEIKLSAEVSEVKVDSVGVAPVEKKQKPKKSEKSEPVIPQSEEQAPVVSAELAIVTKLE